MDAFWKSLLCLAMFIIGLGFPELVAAFTPNQFSLK